MDVPKNLGNQPQDLLISLPLVAAWAVERKPPKVSEQRHPCHHLRHGRLVTGMRLDVDRYLASDAVSGVSMGYDLWSLGWQVVGFEWSEKKKQPRNNNENSP